MIVLICGASHTGKTALAQRLLETYHYPYLSIDHLKMGLIRSGNTALTPLSDDRELTAYLWPIVREMVKTAIENNQNLIVEGCYIPFDWQKDFSEAYLKHIQYLCLIMSRQYIENHFSLIQSYANVIEQRLDDSDLSQETLIAENEYNLTQCQAFGLPYLLIDNEYPFFDEV
jgi:adenylate kinase family enzyme